MVELINALPIPAFWKALTKLSEIDNSSGRVTTFRTVMLSASVLKASNYAKTSGIIATRKKQKDAYFKKDQNEFFNISENCLIFLLLLQLSMSFFSRFTAALISSSSLNSWDNKKEHTLFHCHNQNNRQKHSCHRRCRPTFCCVCAI